MAGRQPSRLRTGPIIAVIVAAIVGGVVGGLIVNSSSSNGNGSSGGSEGTGSVCAAATVAERDLPSVVTIKVLGGASGGTGSGSIIDSEGDVLTNNHVIAAAANGGHI